MTGEPIIQSPVEIITSISILGPSHRVGSESGGVGVRFDLLQLTSLSAATARRKMICFAFSGPLIFDPK